jgi:hypothetical protein
MWNPLELGLGPKNSVLISRALYLQDQGQSKDLTPESLTPPGSQRKNESLSNCVPHVLLSDQGKQSQSFCLANQAKTWGPVPGFSAAPWAACDVPLALSPPPPPVQMVLRQESQLEFCGEFPAPVNRISTLQSSLP